VGCTLLPNVGTALSRYFIVKDCNVDVCCCEHLRFQMEIQYFAKMRKATQICVMMETEQCSLIFWYQ